MISRVWHGWTTKQRADEYESLLRTEVFPGIFAKQIPGFQRIDLFRRELDDEVEFMTVMWFTSAESLVAFVGLDPTLAYVPDRARAILARFEARAAHYEVRDSRTVS